MGSINNALKILENGYQLHFMIDPDPLAGNLISVIYAWKTFHMVLEGKRLRL